MTDLILSNTVHEFDQPMFAQFYEGSVTRGYLCQSFTLASPTSITEVQFSLESTGDSPFTAGSIRVSLYEGGADDKPTGSVLGYAEIPATSLNGAAAFRPFTFSSPIAVTARKYCAVLSKHNIPNPPSDSVRVSVGASFSVDQISGGKQAESGDGTSWSFSNGDIADLMMKVYASAAPTIPTDVTGAVTVPATEGVITLTQDMTVEAAGELTLSVAHISDLEGGKIITVAPGGKIKVGAGHQITVVAGTILKLHT